MTIDKAAGSGCALDANNCQNHCSYASWLGLEMSARNMKKIIYICSAILVLLNGLQIAQALYAGNSPSSYLYLGLISSVLLIITILSKERLDH